VSINVCSWEIEKMAEIGAFAYMSYWVDFRGMGNQPPPKKIIKKL
jgi:hypothetical protein